MAQDDLPAVKQDEFPVEAVDHVRFAVSNARQAAHFYSTAFGMHVTAYRGPENGERDTASYVLESGSARFVMTGEVHTGTWVGESVAKHGDGAVDIALRVPDAAKAYEVAVSRGARGLEEPRLFEDETGKVVLAAIATYGDTRHTLVERSAYSGPFLPGYAARGPLVATPPERFLQPLDPVVGNVELGDMDERPSR